MNVVVDDRLQEVMMDMLNPKMSVSYVEVNGDCLEEVVSGVYARCVDKRADLYIGCDDVVSELRKLGMKCILIEGDVDA